MIILAKKTQLILLLSFLLGCDASNRLSKNDSKQFPSVSSNSIVVTTDSTLIYLDRIKSSCNKKVKYIKICQTNFYIMTFAALRFKDVFCDSNYITISNNEANNFNSIINGLDSSSLRGKQSERKFNIDHRIACRILYEDSSTLDIGFNNNLFFQIGKLHFKQNKSLCNMMYYYLNDENKRYLMEYVKF